MGFLSGVVGAVGGIAGSLLSSNSAKQNAAAANKQTMDLAKNGMQYRTQDLRKAGLNPILAVNGSGGLGSVSSSGIQQAAPTDFSGMANSAVSAYNAETSRRNSLTSKEAQLANEAAIRNQIANSAADVALKVAQAEQTSQQTLNSKTQNDLLLAQILTEASRRGNIDSSTRVNSARAQQILYQSVEDRVKADYLNTPTGAQSFKVNYDSQGKGIIGQTNAVGSFLRRITGLDNSSSGPTSSSARSLIDTPFFRVTKRK